MPVQHASVLVAIALVVGGATSYLSYIDCVCVCALHYQIPTPLHAPPHPTPNQTNHLLIKTPQRIEHKGIKFWCYNAGHVLGAAMFMVEIAGVRLLYTGDYSMEDDRCVVCVCKRRVSPEDDDMEVENSYKHINLSPS